MAKITKRERLDAAGKKYLTYDIRYLDRGSLNKSGKPKHRQESFQKQKDAASRLLELQNELGSGRHIAAAEKLTVAAIAELFMRHQEDRMRDGRIGKQMLKTFDFAVRISIAPLLGGKLMADLRPVDVECFYTSMVRKGGLLPRSARSRVGILRQIEVYAVKRGYAVKTPVATALHDLRGIPRRTIRTFKTEEVMHLLKTAAIQEKGRHDEPFFLVNCYVNIAAFCGLRFGEISALSLADVDLDRRMIHVRRSFSRFDGLKAPKTSAGLRDVPMPQHVADMLRLWMARYFKANKDDLLFIGSRKVPPQAHFFHANNWRPLLKRAGFYKDGDKDAFHFHALRHFAASWLVETLPLTDVAQMLGHAKFDMTLQVYAHPIASASRRHEAVDHIATRLLPPPEAQRACATPA